MCKTAILILASLLPAFAQQKTESAGYQVQFNIRDGNDAAAKTGRRYTMLIDTSGKGWFRVGNKVPYATSSPVPGQPGATQYQYLDTGVNIDSHLREVDGRIALNADIDVSSILHAGPTPTVASLRIGISAMVNPGVPTLVASIDDPTNMRKIDIEATVTKVN